MTRQDSHASFELPAEHDRFPVLREWLLAFFERLNLPVRMEQQLLIAADEIFTNIASYAYPQTSGNAKIDVAWEAEKQMLTLEFSDSGVPFDPLQHDAPDVSVPVGKRAPGGLGILVVQKMMDQVSYRHENNCNILTLRKKAAEGASA